MRIHLRKRLSLCFGLALFSAIGLATPTVANEESGFPREPKAFLEGALEANRIEIEAGKLAQQKATHPAVRQLGEAMAKDHQQIQQKLHALAKKNNVTADSKLQKEHQQQWTRIKEASGTEFDKQFLHQVIQDHQRDLGMLEKCAQTFENNTELKQLIDQHLPMVRRHLEMAQLAADQLRLSARDQQNFGGINDRPENSANQDTAARNSRKDGEVLGLPTSNTDGTILGVLPAPSRTVEAGARESYIARELADGKVDKNVDNVFEADRQTVGAPPTTQREQAASQFTGQNQLPAPALKALKEKGWKQAPVRQTWVYETKLDGESVYVTQDGKLLDLED